jgi:asparagine synthase (glutamine-hydrolysing)
MCGFVGYLLSSDTGRPELDAWSERIRHRGPDQSGYTIQDNFGIGTRRLSIQDLSDAGSQPMRGERYILGFNGEIYNHRQLRDALHRDGVTLFNSHSDTETVLRAIEVWGIPATLEKLNGMYAIAIWDRQSGELSLIRDPLGIKPIFYIQRSEGLYFASESKALLPFSTSKVSKDGLALYLYFGFIPAPFSLIEGVKKVRPGERLIVSQSGMRSEYAVPESWRNPEPPAQTWIERVQQLRSHVENAVERQLISDVPVGVFLSGGVDSTVIANVASRSSRVVTSFSLSPGVANLDPVAQNDASLAAGYAHHLGLQHHEILFDPADIVCQLDERLQQIDEPVAELYALGEIALSEKARSEGVKVVLTGHGADEVFLGYPTYQAAFRGDLYNKIPHFGPVAEMVAHSSIVSDSTRVNLLGAASIWRKSPENRYARVSGVHFSLVDVAALTGLSAEHIDTLVSRILGETSERVSLLPRAAGDCTAERFARMDMMLMVPEHYNTRLDRMTMSASIEARVPLQDLELIGFVAQLTHQDLLRGGLKGMFRHAFKDALTPEIANRPKQTFQAPMLSWVTGPLSPWIEEQVSTLPDMMNPATLHRDLPEKTTRRAYQTWSLALLEGWRKALALEF